MDDSIKPGSDEPGWLLAPRIDWSHTQDNEHFVQFYEADKFMLNSLTGYIGTAINSGDGAIVIATQAHRDDLDELLLANGIDVAEARKVGRYISLDAAETLQQFMVNGSPEPARFNQVLGEVITSVAEGTRRVRAFGEMVALLWDEGNYAGSIRVEELWNNLQRSRSFSLFCAYPMRSVGQKNLTGQHEVVCSVHSRVIPAESYSDIQNPDARLRAIAQLQQQAKALENEVTERRRIEAELRQVTDELARKVAEREQYLLRAELARSEAETANRMKDEFLATVSHELRTPLNAIIGWSHLIKHGNLDEPTLNRAVETIDRNAKSQAQLIEDILDVSRMITGKLRLNNEPVDIASVINAAIDSVQLAIDSKDIHLQLTLDPSARHTVGDASRLQQVVWNLLSNAIKFTPHGGSIDVKVERAGENLQISVSDSGQGIDPAFLPYIFERFCQADGSTTRQHGGLGLGLAIVRHLVELHGGTIKAESDGLNRGATFMVSLPLAPAPKSRQRIVVHEVATNNGADSAIASLRSLEEVKVLLVDDDADTLHILGVLLEDSKATVQMASSVAEALDALRWYRPDVVVSDLAMPDEDGYSFIKKLRALESNGHQMPAVALTSYVRIEDRTRALSAGFNMFVPKPVQPDELINAIANLVEPAN